MNYTTITIKTNKILRDEARTVADKLGVPLSTVINAYLADFVRERRFSVSLEPEVSSRKARLWERVSRDMDRRKGQKAYTDAEKLVSHLSLE